ncbi:MAG: SHOCT domain-containing protein [Lachnospiraceae bacterium]|nr:SHOCT domain-containing protein [Lachnospiraceae bacterium]
MKCLICGGEAAGEVCNQCIRLEKILFQKEWSFKAGLIGKTEDLRVAVSNLRISGRLPMSDNPKALNTRIDNVSHYLMNVKKVEETTYSGKKAVMVTIENPDTKFTRYLYLPNLDDMAGFSASINDAKTKAASLTERIRQQKGLAPAQTGVASTASAGAAASVTTAPRPAAPTAPMPKPEKEENYDTVALSGMADDLSEFETKIKKLKVLRDNGILSEEEYIAEKKKLVSIF